MSSFFTSRLEERIRERLNAGSVHYNCGYKEQERLADLLFELLEDELFHVKQANKEKADE